MRKHSGNESAASAALRIRRALRCVPLDQGIGIPQQHLNGGRRRDPVGTGFEHEHALLVGQRRKGDGQPVPLRERSAASRALAAAIQVW